jgi:hypothetical protein
MILEKQIFHQKNLWNLFVFCEGHGATALVVLPPLKSVPDNIHIHIHTAEIQISQYRFTYALKSLNESQHVRIQKFLDL